MVPGIQSHARSNALHITPAVQRSTVGTRSRTSPSPLGGWRSSCIHASTPQKNHCVITFLISVCNLLYDESSDTPRLRISMNPETAQHHIGGALHDPCRVSRGCSSGFFGGGPPEIIFMTLLTVLRQPLVSRKESHPDTPFIQHSHHLLAWSRRSPEGRLRETTSESEPGEVDHYTA